jgi:hypothetical protein
MINGFILLTTLIAGKTETALHPMPFLAVFFSLVSLHFQIPIYLFFTIGLTMSSFLWLTSRNPVNLITLPVFMVWCLSAVALYYQAGQPLSRGASGILEGDRTTAQMKSDIAKNSLWVEEQDIQLYSRLIALIDKETRPGDFILMLPANPELYFLTQRKNPFRYGNAGQGLISDTDFEHAKKLMDSRKPVLVFYRPHDKYNTAYTRKLIEHIRESYVRQDNIVEFEIYKLYEHGG